MKQKTRSGAVRYAAFLGLRYEVLCSFFSVFQTRMLYCDMCNGIVDTKLNKKSFVPVAASRNLHQGLSCLYQPSLGA